MTELEKLEKEYCMEHAIEWHDLRKSPDDLPKREGHYYCKIDPDYYGEMLYQEYQWEDMVNADIPMVIAWCELPKFKE